MTPDQIMLQEQLEICRGLILKTDGSIISCLATRRSLVNTISTIKKTLGLPVEDTKREEVVLQNVLLKVIEHELDAKYVQRIFDIILVESKKMQEKK